VILTVRRKREGGHFAGDERERTALLRKLASAGFSCVDLEHDLDAPELDKLFISGGGRIIRSLHDHEGVPQDLVNLVKRIARGPGEIPKAAVTPKSSADFLRLLQAFDSVKGMEKVLLGMGDFGFPTRVLAPRLGSLFCYSSPPSGAAAPGHTDPATLNELYRYHKVGAGTHVFGVIGNPVMHSLSPRIHNTGFAELGLDAVYVPFLVDELGPFLQAAELLKIRGLSVTVPHKQSIIRALHTQDPLVRAIGACNTVSRTEDGRWTGTNTDGEGFLTPLKTAFAGNLPDGLGATVIGAGGAARSVVSALASAGARVLILNRTREKAASLAATFGATAGALDAAGAALMERHRDLIVQTTSAGMSPRTAEDPFPGCTFTGREIVYELIYAPPTTAFLSRAVAAGCKIIRGKQMLLSQAIAQFRIFTGRDYPAAALAELESETD